MYHDDDACTASLIGVNYLTRSRGGLTLHKGLVLETIKWAGAYTISMEREIPTCDGCGESGVLGFCESCRTPDHEVEAHNENTRSESHNRHNFQEW